MTATTAARPHLPHIPVEFWLAVAFIVLVVIAHTHARRQAARRRALVESIVADVAGYLRCKVALNRHTFGRAPVRWNGNRLMYVSVTYEATPRDTYLEVKEKLPATLEHRFESRVRAEWNHVKRTATFTAIPPIPPLPANAGHPKTSPDSRVIPFATAAGGELVAWHLHSSSPHALVVGETGKGKSVTLQTVVVEACRRGISVAILDPKRISLISMRRYPGVEAYVSDVDTMTRLFADIVEEIGRRAQLIETAHDAGKPLPAFTTLLVVVDEFVTLVDKVRAAWRNEKGAGEPPAERHLREIILTGRQLHIHVCLATQRPDAEWLKGALRDQLGCRVLVGQAKRGTSQMMEIDGQVGEDIPGRAVVLVGGRELECQVWNADTERLRPAAPAGPVLAGNLPSSSQPDGQENVQVDAGVRPVFDRSERHANGHQMPIPEDVQQRIEELKGRLSIRKIAREVGVSPTTVHNYVKGRPGGQGERRPALHVVRDSD